MRGQCHGGRHGQIIHWQREALHARCHGRTGGREPRGLQHSELPGDQALVRCKEQGRERRGGAGNKERERPSWALRQVSLQRPAR